MPAKLLKMEQEETNTYPLSSVVGPVNKSSGPANFSRIGFAGFGIQPANK